MTGAELKTLRESLNLSAHELADRLGVRSDRTIRHWEAQDGRPVPDGVAADVLTWDRMVEDAVCKAANEARGDAHILYRLEQGEFPGDTLPHSRRLLHAYLARLRRRLGERGATVTVEYQ